MRVYMCICGLRYDDVANNIVYTNTCMCSLVYYFRFIRRSNINIPSNSEKEQLGTNLEQPRDI